MTTVFAIPYYKIDLEKENGEIYLDSGHGYKSICYEFFADVNKLVKKLLKDDPDSMRIARSNFKQYTLQEHVTMNRMKSPIMPGALSYGNVVSEMPRLVNCDLDDDLELISHNDHHVLLTHDDLHLRLRTNSPKPEGFLIMQELGIESAPVLIHKHGLHASWLHQLKNEIGAEYPELY
jgi:hypothetical protein